MRDLDDRIRSLCLFFAILAAVCHPLGADARADEGVGIRRGVPGQLPPRDVTASPEPPASGTGLIEGVVVSADLGRPVRRAAVRLSPLVPGPPRSTTSDDAGRFRFESVTAGQFVLSATKAGYLESTFGQRQAGSGRPGTPLSVAPGQKIERLALPIARGGVLAGSVADDGGEPAFGTVVQAFQFAWQDGERTLRLAGFATADDRGSYRIGALPPGEYVVMATPAGKAGFIDDVGLLPKLGNVEAMSIGRMMRPGGNEPDGTTSSDYAPVFYPGTTSSASAMRVTIGVSEERSGLDVQLPLVPMARVEGIVTSAAGPAPGTEVRLFDLDMPIRGPGLKATMTGPDGRFSFGGVAPGRYRVHARTGPMTEMAIDDVGGEQRVMVKFQAARVAGPNAAAFPTAPAPDIRWASTEITLAGAPPEPITLVLQPGINISGRVSFEGPDAPPADLSSFRLVLTSARPGEDGMSSSLAEIGADGRFTIEGVTPGVYRVNVLSPGHWRAKSFNVGGRDAMDFLLTVTGAQHIGAAEVTMTSRASTLSGTLTDGTGRPAPAHTILVFPDDPAYWVPGSRRIRATRPSTDGQFSVANLPAGGYRLVAVDDLEDGQWFDPDVLRQLSGAALPLTLADGENKTQDLRISR